MGHSVKSNQSQGDYPEKELIEKGFYTVTMTRVSDPQPSSFTKKNGQPADDFVFITFEVVGGEWEGSEFDGSYPWAMWARTDDAGNRVKTSTLQELAEAFLGRRLEPDEEIDFDDDIIAPKLKCQGTVNVVVSKDGNKTYNRLENPLPMPKRRKAPEAQAQPQNAVDEFVEALGDPDKAEAYATGRRT